VINYLQKIDSPVTYYQVRKATKVQYKKVVTVFRILRNAGIIEMVGIERCKVTKCFAGYFTLTKSGRELVPNLLESTILNEMGNHTTKKKITV
jgi:hypothetical protein